MAEPPEDKTCASCGKEDATKICGRCKDQSYCSVDCQRQDWTRHKRGCVPEPTLQLNRAMRLPKVLLDAILSFSDMRTRYFAVTTSHEFCDSFSRLAPKLDGKLVLRRFPLLATCVDGRKSSAPAPRELCEMFKQFFSSDDGDHAPPPASTVGLEDVYAVSRAPAREGGDAGDALLWVCGFYFTDGQF